jgi:hypothetical protein
MRLGVSLRFLSLLQRPARQGRRAEEIPRQQFSHQNEKSERQYRGEAQNQCEQYQQAHRYSPQSIMPHATAALGDRFGRLLRRVDAMQANHRTRVQEQQYRNDAAARQGQYFGIETAADGLEFSRDAAGAGF